MKNLKYIVGLSVVLAGLIILVACEERLDKDPLGDTEVVFFTTQDAFDRGVQGIYAKLTDWYWFNANNPIHECWLLPGDDLTSRGDYPHETFAALSPAHGRQSTFYQVSYHLINRANVMLQKIAEEDGVYLDVGMKDIHKGEALFLRALAFYRLWSFFGTSPVVTERIMGLGEETKQPGSSGTEMLDQAIADLTEAAELLPAKGTWEDKFIGRATKDAANGLLGKCLVTRACYGGGNADYGAAITAFNKISSNTALAPHFLDNFDALNENNVESLFEFQASNAPNFENIWLGNDFNQQIGAMGAYWGFFYDSWTWWTHTPFVPTQKLMDAFEAGDPRAGHTFRSNGGDNFNGWEFAKYTWRNLEGDVSSSLNNPRILRYADVMLLQAEAELWAGSAANALDLVNQVRKRARESVPDTIPVSAFPADLASVTMEDIMHERFVELAGEEGQRFLDLKRWHNAGYINLGNWTKEDWGPSLREDFTFSKWFSDTEGKMLYPIPLAEIDLNPNVSQNKGY